MDFNNLDTTQAEHELRTNPNLARAMIATFLTQANDRPGLAVVRNRLILKLAMDILSSVPDDDDVALLVAGDLLDILYTVRNEAQAAAATAVQAA